MSRIAHGPRKGGRKEKRRHANPNDGRFARRGPWIISQPAPEPSPVGVGNPQNTSADITDKSDQQKNR